MHSITCSQCTHPLGSPLHGVEKVSCVLFQFQQPVGAGISTREDAHPACATAVVKELKELPCGLLLLLRERVQWRRDG